MDFSASRLSHAAAVAVLSLALGASAEATAVWPAAWEELEAGGGVYYDSVGDESPDAIDLVGGNDGVGVFTAGFWDMSDANNQLSIRMRVDADGSTTNSVWQVLFETDGVDSTVDWVLEVRQSGSPFGQQVILTPTTTGGPTFGDIQLSSSFEWTARSPTGAAGVSRATARTSTATPTTSSTSRFPWTPSSRRRCSHEPTASGSRSPPATHTRTSTRTSRSTSFPTAR